MYLLTGLRIIVGWHFLYEGIAKLFSPGWTAKIYLIGSKWVFADFFHNMAASPEVMKVVDFLNIWGLIFIGLSLFIGLLVRWSSIAGSVLLLFYFVAYPPIPGYTFGAVAEGSYLWINKTLIELFILLIFAILPTGSFWGIDRLIKQWKEEKAYAPIPAIKQEKTLFKRREVLRNLISVPFLGAFAYAVYKKRKWDSFEEKFLIEKPDSNTSATLRSFSFSSLSELKGQIPKGRIGNLEISRLIMGGNLIGGWAHARDLLYASELVKAYHSDERVMLTLQLAEKCGINAIITNIALARIINKYWHETGGKIQFLSDSGYDKENIIKSVEAGASAIYFHGGYADRMVQQGEFDKIAKSLELIRSYGKPAGIGCHLLDTVRGCVEQGIKPDFWVKTLHHHNYWSAQVDLKREKSGDLKKLFSKDPDYSENIEPGGISRVNNMFCYDPMETIEYMNKLEEPWIAFKILAAGAIHPNDAVPYAFSNGADFIVLGMYDFQIVEDVNITLSVLNSDFKNDRKRRWIA